MEDVYRKLAQKLDELPNGFPPTESGVELKLLQWMYSPEDAEMTLTMSHPLMPETVEQVAERLGKPVSETQEILDGMIARGQIYSYRQSGQQIYTLVPYIVGLHEMQFHRKDKTEADRKVYTGLFEEYYPSLLKSLGGHTPALSRVVPVSTELKAEHEVYRFEDVRRIVDEAKSFMLMDCICRKERALEGDPCKHPQDICLLISNEETSFDNYPLGKIISREEAHKVNARAEEEGLVHCTLNAEDVPFQMICNCCSCCCLVLRGVKDFGAPHMSARNNFVARIDPDTCTACGVCAEERCPMEAIVEEKGEYRVIPEKCIGCGVCTSTCPTESISLIRKSEPEQDAPSPTLLDWAVGRFSSRGIEL